MKEITRKGGVRVPDTGVIDRPADTGATVAEATDTTEHEPNVGFVWEDGEPAGDSPAEMGADEPEAQASGDDTPEPEEETEPNPFDGLDPKAAKALHDKMVEDARKDTEARVRESARQQQINATREASENARRESYAQLAQQVYQDSPQRIAGEVTALFQQVINEAVEMGEARRVNPAMLQPLMNRAAQQAFVSQWEGMNAEHRQVLSDLQYEPDQDDLKAISDAQAYGDPGHAVRTWVHLMRKAAYGSAYAEAKRDIEKELNAAQTLRETHEKVTAANKQPQPLRVGGGRPASSNDDQILAGGGTRAEKEAAFNRKYSRWMQ